MRKSMNGRQHNGQVKKDKRANNDLKNTTHNPTKTGSTPEGKAVPVPLVRLVSFKTY